MVKFLGRISRWGGYPTLTKIFVERETPKFYVVERSENLMGRSYVPIRLRKDIPGLFDDGYDAVLWLKDGLEKQKQRLAMQLESNADNLILLSELLSEFSKD